MRPVGLLVAMLWLGLALASLSAQDPSPEPPRDSAAVGPELPEPPAVPSEWKWGPPTRPVPPEPLASPPELVPVAAKPEARVPAPAKKPEPPPPDWGTLAAEAEALTTAAKPAQTAAPQTPAKSGVYVEKIGPTSVNVGLPLTYEIVARNAGGEPVQNVRVEEELPAGCRLLRTEPVAETQGQRLGWTVGELAPGAERRFQVEVQPAGPGECLSSATVTFAATARLKTLITKPKLALKKTGPASALVGDPVVFQLELTNEGDGPATNVVLHDRLPPGLQHASGRELDADVGTLVPGETKSVAVETTAVASGEHVNEARVTADNAAPAEAKATVRVLQPALALRKTGQPACFLNQEAAFDLDVSNPGTAPAENVRVVDTLPPGLDYLDAGDAGVYDATARTVTWSLGTFAPAQHRVLQLRTIGRRTGDHVNRAVAEADRGLEAKSEAPLKVEGVPALLLEVVDLDDPVEVGSETTYEVRVLNQGSSPCLALQIIATLPEGMEPRSASGPAPYRIQGRQLVFEPLERLAPRADALFRVRVLCKKAGDWRCRVQMTSDQLRLPVFEEESTRSYKD